MFEQALVRSIWALGRRTSAESADLLGVAALPRVSFWCSGTVLRPLLIVTGAAAAGKTTVCRELAGQPGLLALDGDVIAAGAAAVADGRADYASFWRYVMSIASGVADNGLIPVICGVCLPDQVLANEEECARFAGVHFLVLASTSDELERRIRSRTGADSAIRNIGKHLAINAALQRIDVELPHTLTVVDTTGLATWETVEQASRWARWDGRTA
jgi:hypothetical protein